jgi:hypothetical protein
MFSEVASSSDQLIRRPILSLLTQREAEQSNRAQLDLCPSPLSPSSSVPCTMITGLETREGRFDSNISLLSDSGGSDTSSSTFERPHHSP